MGCGMWYLAYSGTSLIRDPEIYTSMQWGHLISPFPGSVIVYAAVGGWYIHSTYLLVLQYVLQYVLYCLVGVLYYTRYISTFLSLVMVCHYPPGNTAILTLCI